MQPIVTTSYNKYTLPVRHLDSAVFAFCLLSSLCISASVGIRAGMAQRGFHMNWAGRGRRNARPRRNVEDELLRRLEALEARLTHEDSEEEPEVQRARFGAIDPMERLIEAVARQGAKVKVKVPDFKGELNPEVFMDWIQELEKYFEMEGIEETDPRRVKVAASKMKSHAALWWENLQNVRRRQGKEKIRMWPKMLKHLKAKFMPSDYQQKLFREFQNLRQKESSIQAYTEQFLRLQIRTDLQEDDEHAATRYINGLRFQLQDELALLKVNTVDEAYQFSLKAEEKFIRWGKVVSKRGGNNLNRRRGSSSKLQRDEELEEGKEPKTDFGGRGAFRGRGRGQQRFGYWKPLKCSTCGGPHKEVDCPENSRVANGAMMAQEEPQVEEIEAEIGENLMLQRTLIARDQEAPEADWRRKSVFQTKCKCKDKVCKVIVDGGSTDNLVSTEMVQKLQLTCIPKSNPYKISWLKKDHSVLVNQSCLIDFKIGPYEDKVLCDVVPMDACHLLLGRPWQYDKGVIHHGKENTYEVQHGGKKHLLKPWKEEGASEISLVSMSYKKFCKQTKGEICYLLCPREEKRNEEKLPQEVQKLIAKYSDVTPKELPRGLPPSQGITHHIDLVPGSKLPNQAAYKVSSTRE
ncbi:hypothetical protein KI387_042439 [Taxus chinensis]|uniref:Retrotransposon gag domain-containing protein n=1 Tax=Taxus chinensis TaxID=29808 RepID=A0AA38F8J6_TAXCH|nr:hypothetical protein KI387_042439 [Taxus chinensis]